MPDQAVIDAIVRAAQQHGIDPATALAIAERESSFNVRGRAPGSSAYGLFQLLRNERSKYGGSSDDPHEQAEAWGRYADDLKSEMRRHLGRDPTGEELYQGHYWGGARGARLATGRYHPDTPVSEIFTPEELRVNPNIVRAGTAGRLSSSVSADISRRRAKYGAYAGGGEDLSGFGDGPTVSGGQPSNMGGKTDMADLSAFGEAPAEDLSGFGVAADAPSGAVGLTGTAMMPPIDRSVAGTPSAVPTFPPEVPRSTNIEDRRRPARDRILNPGTASLRDFGAFGSFEQPPAEPSSPGTLARDAGMGDIQPITPNQRVEGAFEDLPPALPFDKRWQGQPGA